MTALVMMLAASGSARATSTGLNNIPTADTPPDLTAVVQGYATFGEGRLPDYSAGLKMGLSPWEDVLRSRFEWGIDGHIAPHEAGPAVFQAKYALQPWEKLPKFTIGSLNIGVTSGDRARGGQPYSFAVLTQEFGWFRLTGGYGLQAHHNNSGFVGIDPTFKVFGDHSLTLRSDAKQISRQQQWLVSVGGMYDFCRWFAVETWASLPTDTGEPLFVIKFDIPFDFKRI